MGGTIGVSGGVAPQLMLKINSTTVAPSLPVVLHWQPEDVCSSKEVVFMQISEAPLGAYMPRYDGEPHGVLWGGVNIVGIVGENIHALNWSFVGDIRKAKNVTGGTCT